MGFVDNSTMTDGLPSIQWRDYYSDRMIVKIEHGDVHPRYALSFACDIEQSLVESDLEEAIWSNVAEVKDILARLSRESVGHRNLLLEVDI